MLKIGAPQLFWFLFASLPNLWHAAIIQQEASSFFSQNEQILLRLMVLPCCTHARPPFGQGYIP
jgi:hypothetical protein